MISVEIVDTSCVKVTNVLLTVVNDDSGYSECVTDASIVGSFALELFPTSKKHTEAACDQSDRGNVHNRNH